MAFLVGPSSLPPIDAPARRRRRPARLPAILVAAAGGIGVLGVGLIQTAGGLAGDGPIAASSSSASARAASSNKIPPSNPIGSGDPPVASGPTPAERRLAVLGVRLQAELDRGRAKLAIPGASVTILFPDGTSWFGSSGLADVASRTPVSADTAFAYASISKTFTSALILQLVGAGELSLRDSAASLLPPLKIAIDRQITVAMLLDHTSGLADYFLNPKIDKPLQSRPSAAWTADRALGYVGKRLSPPGKAWHYSNTNYLLLGLIAERVTGQTLAEAVRTRLLDPSELDDIWSQPGEPGRLTLAHGYRLPGTKLTAKPIDLADGTGIAPFRSVITAAGGAGSLAGTSRDLARWARALYSGKVLGPQGTAMLLGGFTTTTRYLPGVSYGYGVQALSVDGHPSLGHSGRLLGFRGSIRHFPLDGLTIAILTNQSRADPATLLRALLAVALPSAPACRICARPV